MVFEQLPFEFSHQPAMAPEDFLVVPGNAEALTWINQWPAWPSPALVVHGPPGCGKSHLCAVWRRRSRAVLLHPEDLRVKALPMLLGQATAVALDHADRVADMGDGERALLHLFNLLKQDQGHLLLLADSAPAHWGLALPDLRSRLVAAPAVMVSSPDDQLLAAMLIKLFADRQLQPGTDVIRYLLPRIDRSFAGVRRVVEALDRAALAERRRISVPLARDVLTRLGLSGPPDAAAAADPPV